MQLFNVRHAAKKEVQFQLNWNHTKRTLEDQGVLGYDIDEL
jgi:hypothetical protein